MTHAQIEPGLGCPGWLKPDRFRHHRNAPSHAWRCSVCRQHFTHDGERILVGSAVLPEMQAALIRAAKESASDHL